jgi:tetratricopeptide (TPR) repeat protein
VLEEYGEAIKSYNRARQLDPSYAGVYTDRGAAYRLKAKTEKTPAAAEKDYQQADDDLARACKLNPKLAWPHAHRGLLYFSRRRQLDRAIDEFQQAIKLDPKEASFHIWLGDVYLVHYRQKENKDDLEAASGSYTQAIGLAKLDLDFARAYRGRADVKRALRKPEAAILDYDKSIAKGPGEVLSWLGRGRAHLDAQYFPQAESDFTRAIDLNPRCAAAYEGRSDARRQLPGKGKEADEDRRQAEELRRNPDGR